MTVPGTVRTAHPGSYWIAVACITTTITDTCIHTSLRVESPPMTPWTAGTYLGAATAGRSSMKKICE